MSIKPSQLVQPSVCTVDSTSIFPCNIGKVFFLFVRGITCEYTFPPCLKKTSTSTFFPAPRPYFPRTLRGPKQLSSASTSPENGLSFSSNNKAKRQNISFSNSKTRHWYTNLYIAMRWPFFERCHGAKQAHDPALGLEPRITEPESVVMPFHYAGVSKELYRGLAGKARIMLWYAQIEHNKFTNHENKNHHSPQHDLLHRLADLKPIWASWVCRTRKISESELLEQVKDIDYLLLNYDAIKSVSEHFYKTVKEQAYPLKAISADITGMTWAQPAVAKKYGVKLLNTPNYSTLSVAEFTITLLLLLIKKMHLAIDDKLKINQFRNTKMLCSLIKHWESFS